MTVAETILVFAVAPLAVVLVLALVTIGPGVRNRRPRYKPGQPWNHEPVWYEPHPGSSGQGGGHGDETRAIGSSIYPERHGAAAEATHAVSGGTHAGDGAGPRALTGGSSAGATAGATVAPRPAAAGPLGGARGTW